MSAHILHYKNSSEKGKNNACPPDFTNDQVSNNPDHFCFNKTRNKCAQVVRVSRESLVICVRLENESCNHVRGLKFSMALQLYYISNGNGVTISNKDLRIVLSLTWYFSGQGKMRVMGLM